MKKIKVRITGFWQKDCQMLEMVKQYAFGTVYWKNIEFTSGNFDKLVILTRPWSEKLKYTKSQALTFRTEPFVSSHNQPHETSFISPLSLPLWSAAGKHNYKAITQLHNIEKGLVLSSVTSDLYSLEGHKARLEFIYAFDKVVEAGFDLFGKNNYGKFFQMINSYRGELGDKFDGLLRYKYHFNCENSFFPNYFTEKLVDPILAECLCFYDGCTNIEEFIDERSFIKINVHKPEEAIETIIDTTQGGERKKRIRYIRKQKKRLLYELNPLNIIWMAVNERDILKECKLA